MNSPEQQRGFQFPGSFEITAMGAVDADLETAVPQCLVAAGVTVLSGSLRSRPSREGRFVAVSVSFLCPDRPRYEAAYAAVRAHPAVRFTL
jgi:hypothetical protein